MKVMKQQMGSTRWKKKNWMLWEYMANFLMKQIASVIYYSTA